jgi:hypothetical protein
MAKRTTKKPQKAAPETPLEDRSLEEQIAWARVHNPSGVNALEAKFQRELRRKPPTTPQRGGEPG